MDELIEYAEMLIQFISERGATFNQETQLALGNFLQNILQFIEQESQITGGTPLNPPPPPPPGMPSSNVAGMNYDDKTGNMLVQFLGKYPNRNGPIYQYPNTPKVIAELLQSGAIPARTQGRNRWGQWFPGKVPSAGASVFTLLKARNAPYQRLT